MSTAAERRDRADARAAAELVASAVKRQGRVELARSEAAADEASSAGQQQGRMDRAATRAAAQVYAFSAAAAGLAGHAALLADDGLRSASDERSGSGGHADPTFLAADGRGGRRGSHTATGAIAVDIRLYLDGMTRAIRDLERLDAERHRLVQTCRPADPRLLEVHVSVPYCLACEQPVPGRRRSGYHDACYQAWRRFPRSSDPGRDRAMFEATRRGRQPAA